MFKLSSEAKSFLSEYKSKTVVFTNGCFDLIHPGHILYLEEARKLGDLLFVGLNSDKSIAELKGPSRPINNQGFRKIILNGLKSVDFVEIFDDQTPVELIKVVKPQIYVKGGDYDMSKIPEYEVVTSYGGKVQKCELHPGFSSTSIIERIKNA